VVGRALNQTTEAAEVSNAKDYEDRLGELEGSASVRYKFLMARRLLAKLTIDQIKPTDSSYDQTMRQVAQLQQEIQTDRPEWPDGYLLKTIQAEAAGDYDVAIEALQRAIELGRREPQMYEQLARLMWKADRTGPEFDQVLAELGSRVGNLSDLSGLSIQRALRSGNVDDALARAKEGVEARPDDPLAHIQLGGVLLAKGDKDAAQKEYEKSTEVAPTDLRTWSALFRFYLQTDQPELARKIIQTIADEQISMQTSDGTRRPLLEAEKQLAIAQLEYQLGDDYKTGQRTPVARRGSGQRG
jgi:tetratricopeptide (TPR) repeat protein